VVGDVGFGTRSWCSGEGCSLMHESFRADGCRCRSLPGMTLGGAVALGALLLGSGAGAGAGAGAVAGCSGAPAKPLPEDASS
jgi:hypothetical protein